MTKYDNKYNGNSQAGVNKFAEEAMLELVPKDKQKFLRWKELEDNLTRRKADVKLLSMKHVDEWLKLGWWQVKETNFIVA